MNEQGKCWHCGSESLTYGGVNMDGEMLNYPYSCGDCGESGKEWYSLAFIENVDANLK